MIRFDYVSDLHVDYWDKNYWPGKSKRKNFPLDWKNKKSDILVVAGDVSDDIKVSFKYLENLKQYYPIILFIDGNHEHYSRYPDLIPTTDIKPPDGIHYLRQKDYIVGKSVFIGTCGWWDYGRYQDPEKVEQTIGAQKGYNQGMGKMEHKHLAGNTIRQSKKDYQYLIDKLKKYSKNSEINEIIIVTHTVPQLEFSRVPATDYNSYLSVLSDQLLQEYCVSRWVFGHNHQSFQKEVIRQNPLPPRHSQSPKSIHYLSNPRGRPDDWNREVYSIATTGSVPVSEAYKL